jgi:virginiamycin B lyase
MSWAKRLRAFAPKGLARLSDKRSKHFDQRRGRDFVGLHRLSLTIMTGALLCSTSSFAQTTAQMGPAALQGTVTSTQEGAMEGVLVSAKRAGSNIQTTVVTDDKGHYAFPASRMQPGRYDLSIRAVGFKLPAAKAIDVAAGKVTAGDLALAKVTEPHELGEQMSNAEWVTSMPGNGVGCTDCHTVHRIVYSEHTPEEWMEIIPRMAMYVNNATPMTPQVIVPGPRQAREQPRDPVTLKRTADYLASVNLYNRKVWTYPLKTFPRPKGRATHVIVTMYELPRPETMPHDAITTPDGRAWYGDFGHQYIGSIDQATGKVTEYQFPVLKPRHAKGFLQIDADPEGNIWGAGMHQGLVAKIDGKTGKTTVYPIPAEWQSNSTQQSMLSPEHSDIDGKVWTNNQDDGSILRLDVKTGKFENFGPPTDAKGVTIRGYGQRADAANNLYVLQFRGSEIGRIDAKTKEVKIYTTPIPNSRPRRGRFGSDGKLYFAENGANAIAVFDPKTEVINEWKLPLPRSTPYDVTPSDKGEIWAGGEYTDFVSRFNPKTMEFVDYLMPREVNIRRVFFDNAKNQFWIGANNSPYVLKVEPLD